VNSLTAAVISNIEQLDDAALFHFSLFSDNKGRSSENAQFNRMVSWLKSSGSEFVLGLGDHADSSTSEPFFNFMKTDSYFNNKFYPTIADNDNDVWGAQGDWGKGRKLFDYVNNFWGRPNMKKNSRITPDSNGNVPDYYVTFKNVKGTGFDVHVLSLHFPDSPSDSSALHSETRAFMQSELEAINAAGKTTRDIVLVLAHSYSGDFIDCGNFSSTHRQLLLTTADFCGAATIHKYGWYDRYKNDYSKKNAPMYNSGASAQIAGGVNGYVEFHVLDNPPRMTIQFINTANTTRKLHVGTHPNFSQDAGKYGTPIIKTISGSWGVVDWNNLPLSSSQASCHIDEPTGSVTKNLAAISQRQQPEEGSLR
jgi:hypothetical protein